MAQALKLNTKPKLERFGRAQLAEGAAVVSADGKPGVIKGVSVITKGEALGHGVWIDDEMLNQVQAAMSAAPKGVKSRFTHPGMCSDGLGKHLGRVINGQLTGSSVTGDLQFAKSAYSTPEGNLAEYVTNLVNDDPEAAGLSIAFERDLKAEMEFALANGAAVVEDDDGYPYLDMTGFKSPDSGNVNNLPHVRMAELRAVDVVDEPAANPNGMFDSNPVVRDADKALAYVLGLSKDKPAESLFGVNVDRASQFVTRFLANRNLKLETNSEPTGDQKPSDDGASKDAALSSSAEAAPTREDFASELAKYTKRFGAEKGVEWFTAEKTFQEALELHVDALSKERDALSQQVKSLNERLSQVTIGAEPLPVAGLSAEGKKPTSISEAKALAAKSK